MYDVSYLHITPGDKGGSRHFKGGAQLDKRACIQAIIQLQNQSYHQVGG